MTPPRSRRDALVRAVAFSLAVSAAGCALSAKERVRIESWLACTECDAGQFDSVVALGARSSKHGAVVAALRADVLLPMDSVGIRDELGRAYDLGRDYALRTFAALPRGWPTRAAWIELHLTNRIAAVQARALRALAAVDPGGVALREVIDRVSGGRTHPRRYAQVFQALRIWVNDEADDLEAALGWLPGVMRPGGVVVTLAYHSGEDRRIKQALRGPEVSRSARRLPEIPGVRPPERPWEGLSRRVVTPSLAEKARNPRARSARLRAFRRTGS